MIMSRNCENTERIDILFRRIKNNKLKKVKKMINKDDLNIINIKKSSWFPWFYSPLRLINTKIKGFLSETPLHVACEYGYEKIVEYLINRGAIINSRMDNGYTPLLISLERKKFSTCEFLIENGADVNAKEWNGYYNVLSHALMNNAPIELIKLILNKGANPHSMGVDYHTPIHIAAYENILATRLLLEKGVDITIPNSGGVTPLMEACRGLCFENVKLLLEYQSKQNFKLKSIMNWWKSRKNKYINMIDSWGYTALTHAITALTHAIFTEHGTYLDKQDKQICIIKYLLREGADFNKGGSNNVLGKLASNIEIAYLRNCHRIVKIFEKERLFQITLGLKSLDLPVLLILEIYFWLQEYPDLSPKYASQWIIAKNVKHKF